MLWSCSFFSDQMYVHCLKLLAVRIGYSLQIPSQQLLLPEYFVGHVGKLGATPRDS